MLNYNFENDEVVLLESCATSNDYEGQLKLTLTNLNLIIETDKKEEEQKYDVVDVIKLETIKFYNDKPQLSVHNNVLTIQTMTKYIKLLFSKNNISKKFFDSIVNVITGTTKNERNSIKFNKVIDAVDNYLDVDTRKFFKTTAQTGLKVTKSILRNSLGGVIRNVSISTNDENKNK